ncbi:MAG: 3'-5' exonuclease [bacterium]
MNYKNEIRNIQEIRKDEFLSEEEKILNIFEKLYNIPTPTKEYLYIKSDFDINNIVIEKRGKFLLNNYEKILNSNLFSEEEKFEIKEAVFDISYKLYDYMRSEEIVNQLLDSRYCTYKTKYLVASFYIITRRCNEAELILKYAMGECDNENYKQLIEEQFLELEKKKIRPYSPGNEVNRKNYKKIMDYLNIEYEIPIKKVSKISRKRPLDVISIENYPLLEEVTNAGFKTFVAFDLETTGFSRNIDSIIELSAIRVIDGVISEEEKFIFTELVYPYKKSISKNITQLTGITNDMVANSRDIWDVFNDFANWLGDDILIGYNCKAFDNGFLIRAGRLSNRIITNKYFDVLDFVKENNSLINSENCKLGSVCESLGIINESAHRALSDSLVTAKVYLKVLELKNRETNGLSDL